MTEATELKPCPSPWHDQLDEPTCVSVHSGSGYAFVGCNCGINGPLRPTEAEAITAWNTRPLTQAGASLTAAQNAGPVMLKALRMISYSIKQANIPGNDWKRELRLIENLALAAIAQAQGPE